MSYKVLTKTVSGWEDCWTENDKPQRFKNQFDAERAITEHIVIANDAAAAGKLDDVPDRDDFFIAMVPENQLDPMPWIPAPEEVRIMAKAEEMTFSELVDLICRMEKAEQTMKFMHEALVKTRFPSEYGMTDAERGRLADKAISLYKTRWLV